MQTMQLKVGEEAEKVPGYLLWQVAKLWQRMLNAGLSDLDLSSTQAVILINIPRLNQEQQTVTQMLLAEVTKIDRMTLSQSIRALERKGLVERGLARANKRAYHVGLTKRGKGVATHAMKRIMKAHEVFFGVLGDNEGWYAMLTQRLIDANKIREDVNERNN